MTPLYTYNSKLLIVQGKLSTSEYCCCSSSSSSSSSSSGAPCDCINYEELQIVGAQLMQQLADDGWLVICCKKPAQGAGINNTQCMFITEYCLGCPEEFYAEAKCPPGFKTGNQLIVYASANAFFGQIPQPPAGFNRNELNFDIQLGPIIDNIQIPYLTVTVPVLEPL